MPSSSVIPPLTPAPASQLAARVYDADEAVLLAPPSVLAAFDLLYIRHPRRWLVAVIAAYLLAATLFAYYTPAWQMPDEPAHYNYIAHIATTTTLPVLELGDYNQHKLDNLLQTNFLRRLTPAILQYEDYQPPLYYLLMTPIYWVSGGSLLVMRLFGVAMGAVTIVLLYHCLALVFPGKTLIPLGAAAFSALLPMHMAMTASVNNDGLAELLLMASLLTLIQWMRHRFDEAAATPAEARTGALTTIPSAISIETQHTGSPYPPQSHPQHWHLLWLGVLMGLGMVTKIYAYLLLPLVLAVIVAVIWFAPRIQHTRQDLVLLSPTRASLFLGLQRAGWVLLPAACLALPTWIRNIYLYGRWDFLALTWHDQVVAGQPRTDAWIADAGWIAYSERAFSFTFQSFWGVFGWMSVFMDERIYTALLIFTGVIFLGVLWATVRFISGGTDTDMDAFQLSVLVLFGLMLLAVTAGYVGYNIKFVQHQGRYFFWGLLPISAVVALGWREVMQPLQGAITGFLAAVLAVATLVSGTVTGDVNKWAVLSIGLFALILLGQPLLLGGVSTDTLRWLPLVIRRWMARPRVAAVLRLLRSLTWALPFILLFVLDLAIPHLFILPQLD